MNSRSDFGCTSKEDGYLLIERRSRDQFRMSIMWPFFRGKELEILLKREDALFELQTNSGMALVITLFAVFFTLLAAVLHGFDTIPPWIVGLESGAVTVMGYVYLRAFLYRRELFPDSETDGAIAPPSVTG